MSLDTSKLRNLRRHANIMIAQCPACAEEGHDSKGDHLLINADGRFGCVCYAGEGGYPHRARIFELVGLKGQSDPINIKVKEAKRTEPPEVIEKDVLGRLGRVSVNPVPIEKTEETNIIYKEPTQSDKSKTDAGTGVPPVLNSCSYTIDELLLLRSTDEESLRIIHQAKILFGGTIVPPESAEKVKRLGKEAEESGKQDEKTKTNVTK